MAGGVGDWVRFVGQSWPHHACGGCRCGNRPWFDAYLVQAHDQIAGIAIGQWLDGGGIHREEADDVPPHMEAGARHHRSPPAEGVLAFRRRDAVLQHHDPPVGRSQAVPRGYLEPEVHVVVLARPECELDALGMPLPHPQETALSATQVFNRPWRLQQGGIDTHLGFETVGRP